MAIYSEKWPIGYALNTVTELELTTSSQNIEENYTTVKYVVRVKKINNWNDNWTPASGGSYTTLSIGGVNVLTNFRSTWTTASSTDNVTAVVASGTTNITHDADGTKNIAYSLTFKPNVAAISNMPDRVITGSFTATTIPRASTFTVSSDITTGSNYTVTISRHSTSFTHKIFRKIGSEETEMTTSNVATSGEINIPHTLFDSHTNTASVAAQIVVKTYNGSTYIGQTVSNVKIDLISSAIPTVSGISNTNSNSGPMGASQYIQGLSRMTLTATGASGSYSSTISLYEFRYKRANGTYSSIVNSTSNSYQYPTFSFLNSGNEALGIATRVRDSRGRYSAWRETASAVRVHYYQFPSLGTIQVRRAGATNTTIQVYRSHTVISLMESGGTTNKNTASLRFQTKLEGAADSTAVTNAGATSSSMSTTPAWVNLNGTYDSTKSYQVRAILSDAMNTVYGSWLSVGTEFVVTDFAPEGMALGKIHSRSSNALEVGGNIQLDGKVEFGSGYTIEQGSGFYNIKTPSGNIEIGPRNTSHSHIYTDRPNFYFNKELFVLGHKVWNSNNDGSGSGLDADLLDGKHASDFVSASSGTGANGAWFQFGELLICVQNFSIATMYSSYTLTGTWTFPKAFSAVPNVISSPRNNLTDPAEIMNGTLSIMGSTTTSMAEFGWMRASGANFTNNSRKYLTAIAMGWA